MKIIMSTALDDTKTVVECFKKGATSYIVKPVNKDKIFREVQKLGLSA